MPFRPAKTKLDKILIFYQKLNLVNSFEKVVWSKFENIDLQLKYDKASQVSDKHPKLSTGAMHLGLQKLNWTNY